MLRYENSRLHIDTIDIERLALQLGTPSFVFSEVRLHNNARAIAEGFRDAGIDARVRYCAKANHELSVLRALNQAGCDVVVSEAAEAELAIVAGFAPLRVSYRRPVVGVREVERACALGVRHFYIYHPGDIDVLERVAEENGVRLRASLHLAPESSTLSPISPLRWVSGRLGLRGAEAMVAARRIGASRALSLAGVSFHTGTQRTSAEAYLPMLRRALGLACRIERELSVGVSEINVGGGFPSHSLQTVLPRQRIRPLSSAVPVGDEPTRLRAFARDVARHYAQLSEKRGPSCVPTLIAEPGRAIVSNAGIALSRVERIKGRWLFLDVTRDFLPQPAVLSARSVLPARQSEARRSRIMHFSGCTLDSWDVLEVLRRVPADLTAGDLLVMADAGAYGITRATLHGEDGPRIHLIEHAPKPSLVGLRRDPTRHPSARASAFGG